jgi:hypothetical protein
MKKNMGYADRVIRLIIAAAIAFLYYTDRINGTAATILLIIAGILLLTGIVGICPLYFIFGMSTQSKAVRNK